MGSNGRNDDDLSPTKRDELIRQYLLERGILDIEGIPDQFLNAANAYADTILGVGKDN